MYLLWPLYLLSLLSSKRDYFDMTLNGLSLVNIFVEGYNENHICILLSVSTLVLFLISFYDTIDMRGNCWYIV